MKPTVFLALCFTSATAFSFAGVKQSAVNSQAAAEAVEIFGKEFPYDRPPPRPANMIGVPGVDIDGTAVSKGSSGKRLTDLSRNEVKTSFEKLAAAYGSDEALQMVKVMPICLSFNPNNFAPALKEFSNIFGDEEACAMVARNPGLLAVDAASAATVTDQTMQFSYLVGYTRPFSKVLLPGLLLALSTPSLEAASGIPLRQSLLESIGVAMPAGVL